MGVGDFSVASTLPKVGSQSGGGPAGTGSVRTPGWAQRMGSGLGGFQTGVGTMNAPAQTGQYTGGNVVDIAPNGQVNVLGQQVGAQQQAPSTPPRDWYDSVGSSRGPIGAPPREPWDQTVGGSAGNSVPPNSGVYDAMMEQLYGVAAGYGHNTAYATADNALNQQMLNLRKQLLGVDGADIGIDKSANRNRHSGIQADTGYLQQQRGMYDEQLANQLAQIQSGQEIKNLDHENAYAAGGAWFTPGQQYRQDHINKDSDLAREAARQGTAMSQLGVDRSITGNEYQMKDLDFDLGKLDNRLASNGINLQMLGLNGQQLQLGLQKRLDDLGLGQFMDAASVIRSAQEGGSEQSDYALDLLLEWLQGGATGPIPGPGIGG